MHRKTKSSNKATSTWSSAPEIMFIFKLKRKFSRAPEQWGGKAELCYWRVYRGQQLPKQSCCSNHRGIFHSAEKKRVTAYDGRGVKKHRIRRGVWSRAWLPRAHPPCSCTFSICYGDGSPSLLSPSVCVHASQFLFCTALHTFAIPLQQGSCVWKRLTSCPVF